MLFETLSGSQYEVDQENKKIRRLGGLVGPTTRQGKDGDWKDFFSISPIVVGKNVVIIWQDEAPLSETLELLKDTPGFVIPATTTNLVSKIINEQCHSSSSSN